MKGLISRLSKGIALKLFMLMKYEALIRDIEYSWAMRVKTGRQLTQFKKDPFSRFC